MSVAPTASVWAPGGEQPRGPRRPFEKAGHVSDASTDLDTTTLGDGSDTSDADFAMAQALQCGPVASTLSPAEGVHRNFQRPRGYRPGSTQQGQCAAVSAARQALRSTGLEILSRLQASKAKPEKAMSRSLPRG